MADPISIASIVLQISQILQDIYSYSRRAKDASADMESLCAELYALKGVLDHINLKMDNVKLTKTPETLPDDDQFLNSAEFDTMLRSCQMFIDGLLVALERPTHRLTRAVQRASWPFKKEDVKGHITRIGRIKSWFVFAMMTDNVVSIQNIYSEVHELSEDFKNDRERRELENKENKKQELLQWLAPVNPGILHAKACSALQAGTGGWFLECISSCFAAEKSQVVWLRAKSGAGKTMLMANAVEKTKSSQNQQERIGVACFYCSFSDPASQEPRNILGSIIAQLSDLSSEMLSDLIPFYENEKSPQASKRFGACDMEFHLAKSLRALPSTFIFIDGVNESKHSEKIITCLLNLARQVPNVRILITSTDEVAVIHMDGVSLTIMGVHPDGFSRDIETFIDASLEESLLLRNLETEVKNEIRETLGARSDGMFRWVQCQIDYLKARRTGRAVRRALDELPDGLDDTYTAMLSRIPTGDLDIAKEALLWLTFACRPLSLQELNEAIVLLESDDTLTSESRLSPSQPFVILNICRGLVTYNQKTNEVLLAHSSVRSYLTSEQIKGDPVASFAFDYVTVSRILMRKCLVYLTFTEFSTGYCDVSELYKRQKDWPLLSYSAQNWAYHANAISNDLDETDRKLIQNFFNTYRLIRGGNFGACVQCYYPLLWAEPDDILESVQVTQPLYYASRTGLTFVVEMLLKARVGVDLEAKGGRYESTALQVACFLGFYGIVALLLEAGADPESANCDGTTCLTWAYIKGFHDIYDLLLRYGAVL